MSEESELALGYTRLSQDGKSLEDQADQIRALCRDRGLELEEVYSDGRRSSGYSAEREAYQELLDRLQEGDVGHVVVRDRSRLSRDAKERLRLLLNLDRLGVDVHVAETGDTVDLDDAYALTRESAQADADDVEKRKEAERGAEEARRREREGLPNGPAPKGLRYSRDKTRWVPGEGFGEVLEALERRAVDGATWRAVAEGLDLSKDTARRAYGRREEYLAAGDRRRDELDQEDVERLEVLESRLVGRASDA